MNSLIDGSAEKQGSRTLEIHLSSHRTPIQRSGGQDAIYSESIGDNDRFRHVDLPGSTFERQRFSRHSGFMSLSHYVWIFSLAEALAVSLLAGGFFLFKWLRVRRKLQDILRETTPRTRQAADRQQHLESITVDEIDTDMAPELNADLARLSHEFSASKSSLLTSQDSVAELEVKYQNLQETYRDLQGKMESLWGSDPTSEIRIKLDEAQSQGEALMRASARAKRNFNLLSSQCAVLEGHIVQLNHTIRTYRASVRELVIERDALAEHARSLTDQLELRERLVERLRHNYDALRHEYDKLYGVGK